MKTCSGIQCGLCWLFLLSVSGCGASVQEDGIAQSSKVNRTGDKLDRATALALIKEFNKSDPNAVQNSSVYAVIPSAIYVDAFDSNDGGNLTAETIANMKRDQQADQDIYSGLTSKGWIREETSCGLHKEIQHRKYSCFAPISGKSQYSPQFDPGDRGNTSDQYLWILVARPMAVVVTGIVQHSSSAKVETRTDVGPLDIYKESLAIVEAAETKYGVRYAGSHWRNWPTSSALTKSIQRAYFFQKYDDGWRAVNM